MTEVKKVTGQLSTPSIYVTCPHEGCDREFDLFDHDECYLTANSDDGESYAWKLFNSWYNKKPYQIDDVPCPSCEKTFTVDRLEY